MDVTIDKLFVKKILEQAHHYTWQLQGLGMFRLYLSDSVRLHLWDSKYKFPNVSEVHTHPWSFCSTIIAGELTNHLYKKIGPIISGGLAQYICWEQKIHCGVGLVETDPPKLVELIPIQSTHYTQGSIYEQYSEEIHFSEPKDGTVTLVQRYFHTDNRDLALVYWPQDHQFGTARSREATNNEIRLAADFSLYKWFE